MSNHNIKYPIAVSKTTGKLIDIESASDYDKKSLICPDCKDGFIAVLNHQTPHFKHKPNSNCSGNVETYLHWITKEIFKTITEIELPDISKENLTNKQEERLEYSINQLLIQNNVPSTAFAKFKKELKKNISETAPFKISNVNLEKRFKTENGDVIIDIVAKINNQDLFIEPWLTNPISNEKMQKLNILKAPTISICLTHFINKYDYSYSTNNLKDFLISRNSKRWIFIREKQLEKHLSKYLNYVSQEIVKNESVFEIHKNQIKKISEMEEQIKNLEEKIKPTRNEIWELRAKVMNLKKELGVKDYYH